MADKKDQPDHDPFAALTRADGSLDLDIVGRRLVALHDLLRHHEDCLDLRADVDRTTELLAGEAGRELRDAEDEDAADAALRAFSVKHLHELVDQAALARAVEQLQTLADHADLPRKARGGAATGVALAGSLPDDRGFRGHGLADVILRVTLEEIHAHQALLVRAREDGGLEPAELEVFWGEYPAVRRRFEQAYRRDVARVLDDIEHDVLPEAVSVDIAIRGAHRLLVLNAANAGDANTLQPGDVRTLLFETFEDDLLDEGREIVLARWRTMAADGTAEMRARRAAERALRIASSPSPGADAVFFQAYARAVVSGCFHVRDQDEATAARAAFSTAGLDAAGVLAYARHLSADARHDDASRVFEAAYELWPGNDNVRHAAAADAKERLERARQSRLGPVYDAPTPDADEDDA